jgi:hypothetical protein
MTYNGIEFENVILNLDVSNGFYLRNRFMETHLSDLATKLRNRQPLTTDRLRDVEIGRDRAVDAGDSVSGSWLFVKEGSVIGLVTYNKEESGVQFQIAVDDPVVDYEGLTGEIINVTSEEVVTTFEIRDSNFVFTDIPSSSDFSGIIDRISTGDYLFSIYSSPDSTKVIAAGLNQPKRLINFAGGGTAEIDDTIGEETVYRSGSDGDLSGRVSDIERFLTRFDAGFISLVSDGTSNPIDVYMSHLIETDGSRVHRALDDYLGSIHINLADNIEGINEILKYLIIEEAPPLSDFYIHYNRHSTSDVRYAYADSGIIKLSTNSAVHEKFALLYSTVAGGWALAVKDGGTTWKYVKTDSSVVSEVSGPFSTPPTISSADRAAISTSLTADASSYPEDYFYKVTYAVGDDRYYLRSYLDTQLWFTRYSDTLILSSDMGDLLFILA